MSNRADISTFSVYVWSWSITPENPSSPLADYRELLWEKTKRVLGKTEGNQQKIEKLQFADEEYYITSSYLLKLAENAGKLFESSEAHEKRLLLKMALQNLELKGKKVRYDWIKPFDKIANLASRPIWLERWYDFRATDWASYLEYPEFTMKQTQHFLSL